MLNLENIQRADVVFRTFNFGELLGSISKTELSEKQKVTLKELTEKETLTPKQEQELTRLIAKHNAPPQLSEGGKTLVKTMFNGLIRGTYSFSFSNKYTEKGILVEDLAINRIAKVNGWGSFLNANKIGVELRDNYGIGHPDAYSKTKKIGFDVKSSFADESFPLFEEELTERNYIWQAKRLAMMSELDQWHVCFSLENTPEYLIKKEAYTLWRQGFNEGQVTDSFIDEVRQMHNFDHLPDWARVRTFTVECTSDDIDLAHRRAELARDYFFELVEKYKLMKKNRVNGIEALNKI